MSQLADLLTELGIVHDNPDKSAAAVRAVLWRHDQGLLNAADTLTVLQSLGLLPSKSGGRYGPSDGRRIAGQKRAAIQRHEESA